MEVTTSMKKKEDRKIDILLRAEPYSQYATSITLWQNLCKDNPTVPTDNVIINVFGSWKNFQQEVVKENPIEEPLPHSFYFDILVMNKQHVTTMKHWDEVAKEKKLPTSRTLLNHVGNWTEIKKKIGITNEEENSRKRSELLSLAKEHSGMFQTKEDYIHYAKEHNLPTYMTIRRFMDWKEFKEASSKE